jgi:hypothetical protein
MQNFAGTRGSEQLMFMEIHGADSLALFDKKENSVNILPSDASGARRLSDSWLRRRSRVRIPSGAFTPACAGVSFCLNI